jgi:hypothetical protein
MNYSTMSQEDDFMDLEHNTPNLGSSDPESSEFSSKHLSSKAEAGSEGSSSDSKVLAITGSRSKVSVSTDEERTRREIKLETNRYPFCLVWTPIPCVTWFIPCIGHTGICPSDGRIHDFAAPYYISVDDMAFGNPLKLVFFIFFAFFLRFSFF